MGSEFLPVKKGVDGDALVWRTLVSTLSLDPDFDEDGAVRLADAAKDLMERGRKDIHAKAAARRWHRFWKWLAIVVPILLVLATLAVVGVEAIRMHADDYAGTDPGSVSDGGYFFIHEWYGQNDLPKGLQMIEMSHAQVDGRKAWLTRWRSASGQQVCAYVWGSTNTDQRSPHGDFGKIAACP